MAVIKLLGTAASSQVQRNTENPHKKIVGQGSWLQAWRSVIQLLEVSGSALLTEQIQTLYKSGVYVMLYPCCPLCCKRRRPQQYREVLYREVTGGDIYLVRW